jgi:hypothetical protein
MLGSRMSSDRLMSFAATIEIPNMSRREEQVWRIIGVAAIAAGIMVAYALSIAQALSGA